MKSWTGSAQDVNHLLHFCKTEIRDEKWCGRRSHPSVAEEGDGPLLAPVPLPCTTATIPPTQTHVPPRDKSSHSSPGAKGGFSPHLAGPLSGLSEAAHSVLPGTLPLVSVSHTPLPFQSTHTVASWFPGPPPSLWTAVLGSWTRPRHRLICPCDSSFFLAASSLDCVRLSLQVLPSYHVQWHLSMCFLNFNSQMPDGPAKLKFIGVFSVRLSLAPIFT